MNYCIIKQGYVINIVVGTETKPVVVQGHDDVVADPEGVVSIGDWYADNEHVFYRPLSTPQDLPEELRGGTAN